MSLDLPSRIKWAPLRYTLGVVICTLVLALAPLLALGSLTWNYLWADSLKVCRSLWLYLQVWIMITGNIWAGVFTRNNWFRGKVRHRPSKGGGNLPPPFKKP